MITKDMGIMDTVQNFPQTTAVFQTYGMGCIGCAAAQFETIEQGARAHGMDIDSLMEALNSAVA